MERSKMETLVEARERTMRVSVALEEFAQDVKALVLTINRVCVTFPEALAATGESQDAIEQLSKSIRYFGDVLHGLADRMDRRTAYRPL